MLFSMGCFNATCIVSGLAIEAGDPVRFLALTESGYYNGNDHICYVTGRWQPRTAPLRAEYNDYGSIENVQESLSERVFFKLFDLDVIEKGVGDNQCHDVHVRKGMSQDEWLTALWEGRVFVDDDSEMRNPNYVHEDKDEYHRKGIPTLARIEKVLKEADLPVTTEYGAKGFVIDDVTEGFIRVRNGRFEEDQKTKALEKALKIIQAAGYAGMIMCGTGNYANNAEILVAPKPGTVNENGSQFRLSVAGLNKEHSKSERAVSQAMIREDVWQILLNMTIQSWRGAEEWTYALVKAHAHQALVEEREWKKKLDTPSPEERALLALKHSLREDGHGNLFLQYMRGPEGVSGVYFRQAFELATELATSDAELEAFVDDLAEMMFVQMAYSHIHGQWHPTTNSGQEGNWEAHREFLLKLAKIKGKWEEDEDEDG